MNTIINQAAYDALVANLESAGCSAAAMQLRIAHSRFCKALDAANADLAVQAAPAPVVPVVDAPANDGAIVMTPEAAFDAALATFMAHCQKMIDDQCNASLPELIRTSHRTTLSIDPGGIRYIRIVRTSGGQRSVYCFIERVTGNILKSESWKRPAKGVRGSIFAPADRNYAGAVTEYGAAYAR